VLKDGFIAVGGEGQEFTEVNLEEDWADYNEATEESVSILSPESRVQ
jgi:hypothetical protein